MAAVFGIVPGEAPVLNGQPRVPEGGDGSMVALGALYVVALENPGDFPVAPSRQVAGQLIAAAVIVVRHTGNPFQSGVSAVEEDDGRARLEKALVEVGVRGGQGGFGTLHQKAAHRLFQQAEEDFPLRADPVFRGVDGGGVGAPVLEAQGLCSSAGIKPFDFSIRRGEVNGFTGLLGSGRSECVRAIFGADHVTGGTVKMDGKEVKIKKPLDAMKLGIGYLPEDRKGDGIVGDLSVRENIILAYQVMKGFFRPISRAQAEAFADNYIKLLEIKTASADTPIKSLSGGNQQKCILARWLLTDPKYLILDEPTRGIDIGTKIEIQKLVLRLAEKGTSATFISSEIDEMLRTCSCLIVMRDRKAVGELSGEDLTQTKIMATIAGGDE